MIDDINLSEEPEHEEGSTESAESTEEPKVSDAFLNLGLQKPSYEVDTLKEPMEEKDQPNAQDDDNDFERDDDFEEEPNVKDEDDDEVIQKVKLEVQISVTGVSGKETKADRE